MDLPDPLVMNDGTRVKTDEQWRERREEMKVILEHDLLGAARLRRRLFSRLSWIIGRCVAGRSIFSA